MDRQLAGADRLGLTGGRDQPLGQTRPLGVRHHPADHVATEDVEDHVEVVVRPLGRAEELGDVPRPHFVGPDRQQLWSWGDVPELVAPFPHLVDSLEEPVHRARRAEVVALVEQRGIRLPWGEVDEAGTVQLRQHGLLLRGRQGPGRPGRRAAGANGRRRR